MYKSLRYRYVRSAVHDVVCVLLHDKRTKIKNMNLDPELDMDWVGSSRVRSGRVGSGRISGESRKGEIQITLRNTYNCHLQILHSCVLIGIHGVTIWS